MPFASACSTHPVSYPVCPSIPVSMPPIALHCAPLYSTFHHHVYIFGPKKGKINHFFFSRGECNILCPNQRLNRNLWD